MTRHACFRRDTSPVLSTCKHNTNWRRLRDQRWKQMTVMNWWLTVISGLAFHVESWMGSMPEELCCTAFSRTQLFPDSSVQSSASFRRVGCHLRLSSRVTMKVGKRVNLAQLLLNKPRPICMPFLLEWIWWAKMGKKRSSELVVCTIWSVTSWYVGFISLTWIQTGTVQLNNILLLSCWKF